MATTLTAPQRRVLAQVVDGVLNSPERIYRTKNDKQVLRNLASKGAVRITQRDGALNVQVLAKAASLV